MTADPTRCESVRDELAELALGVLPAPHAERLAAHVADCAACRAQLDALASTADALARSTPPVEPPAGFESRLLARLERERREAPASFTGAPRRWRRAAALVAAAAVLVVAGVLIGRSVGRPARPDVATAAMVTPAGTTVGRVQVSDDPHAVFVALPGWRPRSGAEEGWYRLRLTLDDGRTVTLGPVDLSRDEVTWGALTEVEAGDVRSVAMVDADGHVYCSARLT